ncbi:MAG: IS200/IS605 family transposase [Thermaerobacter sp.]|nr:IS200/IS605 family transposase [Thermaerobacter sp.]
MGQAHRRTATTVSLINDHFVFCPRYRRCWLVGPVAARLAEIIHELASELNCNLVALEIMPDHCHLFLNALPVHSPALLMARIKGRTSRQLRQEFPRLQRMRSLWTRSYFVSTAGNVSTETVRRYIEEQKKRR